MFQFKQAQGNIASPTPGKTSSKQWSLGNLGVNFSLKGSNIFSNLSKGISNLKLPEVTQRIKLDPTIIIIAIVALFFILKRK